MFSALKSEFRKITTVRSTYVIFALALLLVAFFSFYATGWRASHAQQFDTNLLATQVQQAIVSVGLLGSIVGVLLVTHEYRYNTIMYTLTNTGSRTKVYVAKLLAVTGFALIFTVTMGVLSPLLTVAGMSAHGLSLVPQNLPLASLFWEALFVGWGYSMLSFVFAMIIRVQVGAISAMFLVPAMLEPLLGILLKKNAVYLPYNSLQSVLGQASSPELAHISAGTGAVVIMAYLVLGFLVSWQLFVQRDAQ